MFWHNELGNTEIVYSKEWFEGAHRFDKVPGANSYICIFLTEKNTYVDQVVITDQDVNDSGESFWLVPTGGL